jgi:hypothetical protein
MQCPNCQSQNVQKLTVVYEQGTSEIHASGTSFTSHGDQGVEYTSTHGQSQSILAQKASPPPKQSSGLGILLIIGGIILLAIQVWIAVVVLVIGVLAWASAGDYNKKQWPALYDEWNRKWHCNKCGEIYSV